MVYYKATVEILLEVPDDVDSEGYCADAVAETMRPLLREFAGPQSCWIDWRYLHDGNRYRYAEPHDGSGFEGVEKE